MGGWHKWRFDNNLNGAIMFPMNAWLKQMFAAGQASKGGLIRRSIKSVSKYGGGEATLVAEAKAKGFHVIQTGKQYLVMCHPGDQKIIC